MPLTAATVPSDVRCMSFWWPNLPLTQTIVPSSAVICWAAGSAATSVSAAVAVAGAARAAAATSAVSRRRAMASSSAIAAGVPGDP